MRARAVEQVLRLVDQIWQTRAIVQARHTATANQRDRTVLAAKVGIAIAFIVIDLVNTCAILAGIVAITFINIDLTVCSFKSWITFTGIGANLENKLKRLLDRTRYDSMLKVSLLHRCRCRVCCRDYSHTHLY